MLKNNLKEIRTEEYNLSPTEFSKLLGINRKTYYHLEAGESFPPLEKAFLIAKKLNKDINQIWYLVDES